MFRFRFEALLNHHRHQEEVSQIELARAQRRLTDEQGNLRRQKTEKRVAVQKLQTQQKDKINVSDIIMYLNFIERLSKNIARQVHCVQVVTKSVNQKRSELIKLMKKRKTLERLKEKEWLAYQQKMQQNERKRMDEAASIRHGRKM
jgi:flagellar FliJ protein